MAKIDLGYGMKIDVSGTGVPQLVEPTGIAPAKEVASDLGAGTSLPYHAFKVRHPEYDCEYWKRLRALYKGGQALLQDIDLMKTIFIRNNAEPDELWLYRVAIAFYVNYCSEIVDNIIAGLEADPIKIRENGGEVKDAFVESFIKNVTSPGGDEMTLQQLGRAMLLEAQQVRRAWCELSMPPAPPEEELQVLKLADQEKANLLDVWAHPIPAEQVLHWQVDATGELVWALVLKQEVRQEEFWKPAQCVKTWTRWTRTEFTRWQMTHQYGKEPNDDEMVPCTTKPTKHSFQRVPLLRFELPHGLWAMDRLESIARAHFNKRNILDVAERRSLLPVLYEFQGAEASTAARPTSVAQQDPNRAVNTPRGAHYVQRRGKDDDAKFVGPDSAPFEAALKSCSDLRQEMHRITYQMALAADFESASALGRSGESKGQDKAATAVVLKALGTLLREWILKLIEAARIGRGDRNPAEGNEQEKAKITAHGLAHFDDLVLGDLITQTGEVMALGIQSPRALREVITRVLRRFLGDLDQETWDEIEEDLKRNMTPENLFAGGVPGTIGEVTLGRAQTRQEKLDKLAAEGEDVEDEEEDEPVRVSGGSPNGPRKRTR